MQCDYQREGFHSGIGITSLRMVLVIEDTETQEKNKQSLYLFNCLGCIIFMLLHTAALREKCSFNAAA